MVTWQYAWAIKNDLAMLNPAGKLEKLGGRSDGFYTWTDQDVETFEAFWIASQMC
jgi:hypothetical protein